MDNIVALFNQLDMSDPAVIAALAVGGVGLLYVLQRTVRSNSTSSGGKGKKKNKSKKKTGNNNNNKNNNNNNSNNKPKKNNAAPASQPLTKNQKKAAKKAAAAAAAKSSTPVSTPSPTADSDNGGGGGGKKKKKKKTKAQAKAAEAQQQQQQSKKKKKKKQTPKTRTRNAYGEWETDESSSDDDDDRSNPQEQKRREREREAAEMERKSAATALLLKKEVEKNKKKAAMQSSSSGNGGMQVVQRKKRGGGGGGGNVVVSNVVDLTGGDDGAGAQETVRMQVSPKHYGMLIGPKGATLLALQSGCGVLIDIPKRDTTEQHVTIKGTAEAIAKARANIKQMVEQGYCAITHPDVYTETISVPVQSHGIIIGPGGSHIHAIQSATEVKVVMPDRKTGGTTVKLLGSREQCAKAKAAIRQLVTHSYSSLTHPGFVQQTIEFPYDRISELIGVRGQTIKSIQGNTRTKINIPDNNDRRPNVNVVVVGLQAGVAQAQREILALLVEPTEEEEQAMMAKWALKEARREAKREAKEGKSAAGGGLKNRARGAYNMDAGDPMANDDDLDDDAASYVYRRPQAANIWGAGDDDEDDDADDAIFAPEAPPARTVNATAGTSAADKVRPAGKPWG